jgi:hypothetical protein
MQTSKQSNQGSIFAWLDVISQNSQKRVAVFGVAAAFLVAFQRSKVYESELFKRFVASWPPSVKTLSRYGPAVVACFLLPIAHRVVNSFKPLEANEAQSQWKSDEMQKRRAVLRNLLMLSFKLAKSQSREKMESLLGRINGGSELRTIQDKIRIESGEEAGAQDSDRQEQQWEKRLEAEVQFKDVKQAVGHLQEGLSAGEREPLVTAGYVVAAVLLANDLDFTTRETTLAHQARKGGGGEEVAMVDGEEANEKYRDGKELETLVKRAERMDEFLRSSSLDLFSAISSSFGAVGDFSPEDQKTIRLARSEYWNAW